VANRTRRSSFEGWLLPFQGWPLVGWAALLLALTSAGIFALEGWSEEAVRTLVRATARVSIVLFLLAFAASSLRRVWRSPASAWLLRNRRYMGVSFGLSHFVHLGALLALGSSFPEPFLSALGLVTILGGGLAYVFIAAMVATSFDRTAAWLGPRRWKLLHRVGSYYIWIIFAQSYLPRALADPRYAPPAIALFAVLALRFGVRAHEPRARRQPPPSQHHRAGWG